MTVPPLIHLSAADVDRCALTPIEVAAAVRDAFAARAAGAAVTAANLHLSLEGRSFSAKAAVLSGTGFAAVKWFGNVAQNERRGLADYNPLVLLNDVETGLTLALMDGAWITATRTSAISAVAAGRLAPEGATRLGIVGCGRQAAAHLEAMRLAFPIVQVALFSRRRASAERLAAAARSHGIAAKVVSEAREAVSGQQIVLSTVALDAEPSGFLRADWVDDGAFVSMVDLGFSWDAASIGAFELLVTDQLEPGARESTDALHVRGPFHADLSTLLTEPRFADARRHRRKALLFAGCGLADVAVAAAVYRRARQLGLGLELAR